MKRRLMVVATIACCWTMVLAIESSESLPGRDLWAGCFAATAFAVAFKSKSLGIGQYFEGIRQRILAAEAAKPAVAPAAVAAAPAIERSEKPVTVSVTSTLVVTGSRRQVRAPLSVACAS